MYNNHQGGVFTIRGDMCYENKAMTNSALSVGSNRESICLSVENASPVEQLERHRSRFVIGYVINSLIGAIVIVFLAMIEFDIIPTNKLGYYCHDPSLSHPFTGDTISNTALLLGSFFGPIVVFAAIEFRTNRLQYGIRVIWKWYKEMIVASFIVLIITEIMKAIMGSHRPHFITTCVPDAESTCLNGTFVYEYTCTGPRYNILTSGDSSRSFPSAHTSISVFVSLYCAVFIHYRFTTRKYGKLLKPLIIVMCLSWGTVCGLTRIADRRHHWWDVLAGAIFGIIGAIYAIVGLVNKFEVTIKNRSSAHLSPSTTALIDKQNKDATSVII